MTTTMITRNQQLHQQQLQCNNIITDNNKKLFTGSSYWLQFSNERWMYHQALI